VYLFILVGGAVVIYFVFPETRGHSLEEIARIFDKSDAAVPEEGEITEKIEKEGVATHVNVAGENTTKV
jgi:hypothetical protein